MNYESRFNYVLLLHSHIAFTSMLSVGRWQAVAVIVGYISFPLLADKAKY